MVRTLLRAGWGVAVHGRRRAVVDSLVQAGAHQAESPAALAAAATVIITSLPGEREVREVTLGEHGVRRHAKNGTIVIDTSTIAPNAARELAGELGSAGIAFVDAPVSGGPPSAAAGSLVVMAGGEPETVCRVMAVLETLGTVFYCGTAGAGQVCKACNQLVVVGTIELVAEALVLAAASGLNASQVRAALLRGYAASRVLEQHGERMLNRDFAPGGKAKFNLKDIEAIRGLASSAGLELLAFEATAAQLIRLVDSGGGDLDNSALVTVVESSRAGSA